jgi:flagellar L-ring protein precursor FlgH
MACGHSQPYQAKHRDYHSLSVEKHAGPAGPSLYAPGGLGLIEDTRAARVGDVLVIVINETDSGSHNDNTTLAKTSSTKLGLPGSFGVLDKLQQVAPTVNPSQLFDAETANSFNGGGTVKRNGQLSGVLPVRVREVLDNGDLFVEGTKTVTIGNEEHHLYLSGVVRPVDVAPDDTVPSSRVADAEIEYTSSGDLDDQQRQGWFTKILLAIWPF